MAYRLMSAFEGLFNGTRYRHRQSHLGDLVAANLFEDLVALNCSPKLAERVQQQRGGVNTANVARRGDGTFGELVPGAPVAVVPGFIVPRGRIAAIEVGAETKILAKAMIKQN